MHERQDIVLVVDYHAKNIEFRWFNRQTGEERTGKFATDRSNILRLVEQAAAELAPVAGELALGEQVEQAGESPPGGKVVWVMESTTGWARVKELLGSRAKFGSRVEFVLANVLQMPLPPKGRRRKTDKIDTARILREYLNGSLPRSFQPESWWRQMRRLVDTRQDLVERRTAIKNWITSLLHHETWENRENLWSGKGLRRLRAMKLPARDRLLVDLRIEQLEQLAGQLRQVEAQMQTAYDNWPEAQWLDAVRGIGMVTAVSLLAHIGPIERFATAEELISYAGLAPGMWQSDGTQHHGRIGGGGTDGHLRYLLIEASTWLCQIPRYRPTYERILKKRGKKIARIVVARMLLRSIHKMLRDQVRFNPDSPRAAAENQNDHAIEVAGGPARKGEKDSAFIALEPTSGRIRKAKVRDSRRQSVKGPGLAQAPAAV